MCVDMGPQSTVDEVDSTADPPAPLPDPTSMDPQAPQSQPPTITNPVDPSAILVEIDFIDPALLPIEAESIVPPSLPAETESVITSSVTVETSSISSSFPVDLVIAQGGILSPSSASTTPAMPLPGPFSPKLPSDLSTVPTPTSSQTSGQHSNSGSPMSLTPVAVTPTPLSPTDLTASVSVPTAVTPTDHTPTALTPTALTPTNHTPTAVSPLSLAPFEVSPTSTASAQTSQPLNLSSLTLSSLTAPTSIPHSPILTSIPIHYLPSIVPLSPQSTSVSLAPLHTPTTTQAPTTLTISSSQPTVSQDPNSQDPDSHSMRHDPLASPDWDRAGPPGNLCAGRVRKDLSSIFHEPLPGIFAVPEEDNMFKVHCLIIGPFDTPYEGGFFHFLVRFGPQYPLHPPRVKLLTTGGGTVRFNPNLYRNGKVCLSILGTWPGPAWSPASNLSSVLLSLQSLMNERPYHNEPGYDEERNIGDSDRYNLIIEHETLRVSVLQQLESPSGMPSDLLKVMQESFMEYYDHYVDVCQKNMYKDGTAMNDPFGEARGRFRYAALLKQLRRLKAKLKASGVAEEPDHNLAGAESEDASSISGSEDGSPESFEE